MTKHFLKQGRDLLLTQPKQLLADQPLYINIFRNTWLATGCKSFFFENMWYAIFCAVFRLCSVWSQNVCYILHGNGFATGDELQYASETVIKIPSARYLPVAYYINEYAGKLWLKRINKKTYNTCIYVYPTHQRHVSRQENSRLEKKVQDSCNFQLQMGWCQFLWLYKQAIWWFSGVVDMFHPFPLLLQPNQIGDPGWVVSPSKRMIWRQEFQCGKMSNVETTHGLSNKHTIGLTNLWNKSLSLTQLGPFTEPTD